MWSGKSSSRKRASAAAKKKKKRKSAKTGKKKKSKKRKRHHGSSSEEDEEPKKRKATGGFAMEYILSKQLAEIVGLEKATRGTIAKQVWAYVKERDLQDPENKQYILCDDKLKKLFDGTERIRGFSMSKYFGKHLIAP